MDVGAYVREFNAAVVSGEWSRLVAWFSDDAVLEFVGLPVGPFVGRGAIAAAYVTSPPDDTIEVLSERTTATGEWLVHFRWSSSEAGGTMTLRELGQQITRLAVTFGDPD